MENSLERSLSEKQMLSISESKANSFALPSEEKVENNSTGTVVFDKNVKNES